MVLQVHGRCPSCHSEYGSCSYVTELIDVQDVSFGVTRDDDGTVLNYEMCHSSLCDFGSMFLRSSHGDLLHETSLTTRIRGPSNVLKKILAMHQGWLCT